MIRVDNFYKIILFTLDNLIRSASFMVKIFLVRCNKLLVNLQLNLVRVGLCRPSTLGDEECTTEPLLYVYSAYNVSLIHLCNILFRQDSYLICSKSLK